MATEQQIADLRVMINEPTQDPYTDEYLGAKIDAADGNLEKVAGGMWREKSARYAELVDIQEGSSKRSLSQLAANAVKLAGYYDDVTGGGSGSTGRVSRTRPIERP